MTFDLRRFFLSLVPVLAFVVLARPAVSEFYASEFLMGNSRAILTALAITGEDARYSRALGCEFFYRNASGTANLEKAAVFYRESLAADPLDAQTWLSLAQVYGKTGKKDLMDFALKKALDGSAGDPRTIWDSGVFFLQLGNTQEAIEQFRKYILINPDEQQKVYELCVTLGLDPLYMQDKLVPLEKIYLHQWFDFLLDSNLTDAAGHAWAKLRQSGPGAGDYLRYCCFLIDKGRFTDALAVWNCFFGQLKMVHKNGRIWNGDFDLPLLEGGFDWRIGRAKGVRIFLDRDVKRRGRYSLGASFDGTTNPDIFLARQVVPVEKGHSYTVYGYIKTTGITTANGIFFEVRGYKCAGLEKNSEPVTGTNFWKKVAVEFSVPPQCGAVTFGIRRAASTKLDNRISGDIWVDSIHMTDSIRMTERGAD